MTVTETVSPGQTRTRQRREKFGISKKPSLILNTWTPIKPDAVADSRGQNPYSGARQRYHRSSSNVGRKPKGTELISSSSILPPESAVVLATGGDRQTVSKTRLDVPTDHAGHPSSSVRGVLQRDVSDSPTTRQMNGSIPVVYSTSTVEG
jgi:hypothetical protein